MLSRDKTENNFGVAFFCTEHIHFCSFFGKLHIVLGHMIGGSARTKLHEGAVAYSGISNSTRSLYSSLRQFFYIVNRGVDLIVSVRYDPKKLSRAALILKDYLVWNT
ncbi:hypothetical protein T03_5695 [Trichinella britovi]|uniref:Uncharacterized protein n=1 Tax=Trichinella britovi TaxID=45882 RepID=A0A0V1DGI1_TRIBR|nr:hypothetical protein T03_5695 [Trichinella britovi]